jgi:hypothetical protein
MIALDETITGLTDRIMAVLDQSPGIARSSLISYLTSHYNERQDSISSTLIYLTRRGRIVESVSFRTYEGEVREGPTHVWRLTSADAG